MLTPADEEHHVDKWKFRVPFVCGCRNLGEPMVGINISEIPEAERLAVWG